MGLGDHRFAEIDSPHASWRHEFREQAKEVPRTATHIENAEARPEVQWSEKRLRRFSGSLQERRAGRVKQRDEESRIFRAVDLDPCVRRKR
jgi:sigma54-dependent transcription regulator